MCHASHANSFLSRSMRLRAAFMYNIYVFGVNAQKLVGSNPASMNAPKSSSMFKPLFFFVAFPFALFPLLRFHPAE